MKDKIIEKKLKDELMLYNAETDSVHVLNQTAEYIYVLHKQGKGIDEIEADMRDRFSIDEGYDLRKDIESCIQELANQELFSA